MAFNLIDFLSDGTVLKLPNTVSYSLNNLSRVNEIYQYTDVATGNTTSYDLQTAPELAKDPFRFDTGSLQSWASVDTSNIVSAMAEWAKVIPVSFSEVASGTPTITISAVNNLESYEKKLVNGVETYSWKSLGGICHSYVDENGNITRADILLNSVSVKNGKEGTFGYQAMLHELGHALGLKHPFNKTLIEGPYNWDNTIMEYEAGMVVGYPISFDEYRFAVSPMVYDIAAAQQIYGEKTDVTSGNDTYTLTGKDAKAWTLWDADGVDTIKLAELPEAPESPLVFDLRGDGTVNADGTVNWIQYGKERVSLALDPKPAVEGMPLSAFTKHIEIENFIGSKLYSNYIYGNTVKNKLAGGDMKDILIGDGDEDELRGGGGTSVIGNILVGGYGNITDTGTVYGVTDDFVKDVIYSTQTSAFAVDTIYVGKYDEIHVKSPKSKIITLANAVVHGGTGADTISGEGGKLAGLVANIYNKQAVVFDNMAFENAANDNINYLLSRPATCAMQ